MRINPTDEIRMIVAGKVEVFTAKELAEELRALLAPDFNTAQGLEQALLDFQPTWKEQDIMLSRRERQERRLMSLFRAIPSDGKAISKGRVYATLMDKDALLKASTLDWDAGLLRKAGFIRRGAGAVCRIISEPSEKDMERLRDIMTADNIRRNTSRLDSAAKPAERRA